MTVDDVFVQIAESDKPEDLSAVRYVVAVAGHIVVDPGYLFSNMGLVVDPVSATWGPEVRDSVLASIHDPRFGWSPARGAGGFQVRYVGSDNVTDPLRGIAVSNGTSHVMLLGSPRWPFVLRVRDHDLQMMEPVARRVFGDFFSAIEQDYRTQSGDVSRR